MKKDGSLKDEALDRLQKACEHAMRTTAPLPDGVKPADVKDTMLANKQSLQALENTVQRTIDPNGLTGWVPDLIPKALEANEERCSTQSFTSPWQFGGGLSRGERIFLSCSTLCYMFIEL